MPGGRVWGEWAPAWRSRDLATENVNRKRGPGGPTYEVMAGPEPQNYIRGTMKSPTSFPGRSAARVRRAWLVTLAGTASLVSTAVAANVTRYSFEVPDRLDAAYEVPLEVQYPGRIVMEAEWGGGRILSFRLEGAGSPPVRLLRSGPSPQRIEAGIAEGSPSIGAPWRLLIRALPGRGASQVSLSIDLPEPPSRRGPAPAAQVQAEPKVAEPPAEAWARPAPAKAEEIPALAPLVRSIERFRAAVVGASGEFTSDPCSWHSDFLRRVAAVRDALAAGASAPTGADASCMGRLAKSVRRVDEFRTSADPVLTGPVPADARERIIWRARRGDLVRPLESDLDTLLAESRKTACPLIQDDVWPSRFAACLVACERYFEERVRTGEEAANADLARTEWDRYLEAAEILEDLTSLSEAPTPPAD